MRRIIVTGFLSFVMSIGFGQAQNVWNNKQCAVVLTYDDGLNQDLTNAIPALDKVGLKGTFYIADFGDLKDQLAG